MKSRSRFKGFRARLDSGTPCYVINESTLSDGTPAWKVTLGWSWLTASARQKTTYDGPTGLVAKSKVTRD